MPNIPAFGKLSSLGYRLFGPVITPALYWILTEAEKDAHSPLLFIGREGYFLRSLADHMASEMRNRPQSRFLYLDASRSFLFKLLLDQPLVELSLSHHFSGGLHSFFVNRFALSDDDAAIFTHDFGFVDVELPRDAALLKDIITSRTGSFASTIQRKRERYLSYLDSFAEGEEYRLVDVGFSGTIQKCIGALTGRNTKGYYFYKSANFNHCLPPGNHTGKAFWSENAEFGKSDPLIDFSLVLESLLTAPWGTLRDIRPEAPTLANLFVYADKFGANDSFHALQAIIAGVRAHITEFIRVGATLEDLIETVDVRKIYNLSLRFDTSEEMNYVRAIWEIDDAISGHGKVKPFDFLPGLSR